jgi:hypothetical protein
VFSVCSVRNGFSALVFSFPSSFRLHPSTTAGGSPAAGHFLLFGQAKVTKEKAAQVRRHLLLRRMVSLRCSISPAAAQLAHYLRSWR